jgi:uncharacterized membrane protein YfcA
MTFREKLGKAREYANIAAGTALGVVAPIAMARYSFYTHLDDKSAWISSAVTNLPFSVVSGAIGTCFGILSVGELQEIRRRKEGDLSELVENGQTLA